MQHHKVILWLAALFIFAAVVHRFDAWIMHPVQDHLVPLKKTVSRPVQISRRVNIQLTTATAHESTFLFYPEKSEIRVHPGEENTVFFYVKNEGHVQHAFHAVAHVAPMASARFLERVKGFGQKHFVVQPNHIIPLAVTFFVDPSLPKTQSELTLNYTLFPDSASTQQVGS